MSRLHYENDGQEWAWWQDNSPYCYYTNKLGMELDKQVLTALRAKADSGNTSPTVWPE